MPKWAKFIIAILLLPVCFGAIRTLWLVFRSAGGADQTWVPLLAGFACWICIFVLLPKPMWIYVFGHEFTHVLWTWLFGGRVKRFRATARGGHVIVTKTNFLIALAAERSEAAVRRRELSIRRHRDVQKNKRTLRAN